MILHPFDDKHNITCYIIYLIMAQTLTPQALVMFEEMCADSMALAFARGDFARIIYNGPGNIEDAIAELPTVGQKLQSLKIPEYDPEDYVID